MGNSNNKDEKSCIFCDLLTKKHLILAESDNFFAFHDITKSSAQEHILVCTKQHIKNAYFLNSPQEMHQMKSFGQMVLNKVSQEKGRKLQDRKYRFGFHLPPYNSVHHVHLHCFVEPFSSVVLGKWHFGYMLHSLQDTQRKWKKYRGHI